jgi:hypothetical protein
LFDQVLRLLQHLLRELRLGPNANDVHIANLLNQLVFRQAGLQSFNLVSLSLENVDASLVHVLQQQNFEVFGIERLQLFRELRGMRERWLAAAPGI